MITPKLNTPEDIRGFLAGTIEEVRRGKLEINTAKCIGYLCNTMLGIMKHIQLEDKVSKLEDKMKKGGVNSEFIRKN